MGDAAVEVIDDDLLDAPLCWLLHQCDCVSTHSAGLAAAIFKRFPAADVYTNSTTQRRPGEIEVRGRVIALYAQYAPDHAQAGDGHDSALCRHGWFRRCLEKAASHARKHAMTETGSWQYPRPVLAVPYGIGCGLAGGNWSDYVSSSGCVSRVKFESALRSQISILLKQWESSR